MKLGSAQSLIFGGLLLLVFLTGCGGSGNDPVTQSPGDQSVDQSAADTQQTEAGIQDDADSQAGVLQCDVTDFDIAELVFTESDRQWYCGVSSSQTTSSDEVFFSRNGTAVFSQYDQVYWNRNLSNNTLTIASPLMQTMTLRDINSANTTLQFKLGEDPSSEALYDCVLVQREDIS